MAKRTRTTLLSEIDSYSKSIAKVSTWHGTKKPFGHILSSTLDNYIYEFWCYLKILVEINKEHNQQVLLITGSNIFPTAPASKKNDWSYYEIRDATNNLLYMVCAGTGIKRPDALTTIHHPDISFQKPTSPTKDDPSGDDVIILLDAKYEYPKNKLKSSDETGKISKANLDQFSHIVEVLFRKNKTQTTTLNFGTLKDLNANCLLSNALPLSKHKDACKIDSIKQVGEFIVGKKYTIVP